MSSTERSFQLTLDVSAGRVVAEYVGLPNRDPQASGDFVGAWTVAFSGEPAAKAPVPTPNGAVVLEGLQVPARNYAIGYSVGPDPKGGSIAALAQLVNGQVEPATSVSVSIIEVGPTSLVVGYSAPSGENPRAFGHSLVLVSGQMFQPGVAPVATMSIQSDQSSGAQAFSGVNMVMGQWYTIAYLAGPKPVNLAATASFQVGA